MSGYDFIFSQKPILRITRHLAFWMICLSYFLIFPYHGGISHWPLHKIIFFKGAESLLLLLSIIPFTYWFLYFLVPRLFIKKRVFLFMMLSCLTLLLIALYLYLNYLIVYHWLHPSFFGFTTNISHEDWGKILISPLTARVIPVCGLAITLKYLKVSWQKQREIETLEKEKLGSELKLLKTQVSSDFILSSLEGITKLSEQSSPEAPRQVLQLSGLLRYLLYESAETTVLLAKEIESIRSYISLRTISKGKSPDTSFQINGDTESLHIAPLLLLPLIEGSFKICTGNNTDEKWITIYIKISGRTLFLKINYSNPVEYKINPWKNNTAFETTLKRLHLHYPNGYDLKNISENEMSMISLKLDLEGQDNKVEKNSHRNVWKKKA